MKKISWTEEWYPIKERDQINESNLIDSRNAIGMMNPNKENHQIERSKSGFKLMRGIYLNVEMRLEIWMMNPNKENHQKKDSIEKKDQTNKRFRFFYLIKKKNTVSNECYLRSRTIS